MFLTCYTLHWIKITVYVSYRWNVANPIVNCILGFSWAVSIFFRANLSHFHGRYESTVIVSFIINIFACLAYKLLIYLFYKCILPWIFSLWPQIWQNHWCWTSSLKTCLKNSPEIIARLEKISNVWKNFLRIVCFASWETETEFVSFSYHSSGFSITLNSKAACIFKVNSSCSITTQLKRVAVFPCHSEINKCKSDIVQLVCLHCWCTTKLKYLFANWSFNQLDLIYNANDHNSVTIWSDMLRIDFIRLNSFKHVPWRSQLRFAYLQLTINFKYHLFAMNCTQKSVAIIANQERRHF